MQQREAAPCFIDILDTPVSRNYCRQKDGEILQKTEETAALMSCMDYYLYYCCALGSRKIYRSGAALICGAV